MTYKYPTGTIKLVGYLKITLKKLKMSKVYDKIIIGELDTWRNKMKRYSYYTPIELAECILKLLPNVEMNTVIDICRYGIITTNRKSLYFQGV